MMAMLMILTLLINEYYIKKIFVLLFLIFLFSPLHSNEIEHNKDENNFIDQSNLEDEYDSNVKKQYVYMLYSRIGYSFLLNSNISLGLDFALAGRYPWQWEFWGFDHFIGIEYQYLFK